MGCYDAALCVLHLSLPLCVQWNLFKQIAQFVPKLKQGNNITMSPKKKLVKGRNKNSENSKRSEERLYESMRIALMFQIRLYGMA